MLSYTETRSCHGANFVVPGGTGGCHNNPRCRQARQSWHRDNSRFSVYLWHQCRFSLRWRHNERDGVSNHQPHDCLLNRLFRHRWKKTSKFRVTGLCAGNSPVTGEFPTQRASNAENVSIWWRHHVFVSASTLAAQEQIKENLQQQIGRVTEQDGLGARQADILQRLQEKDKKTSAYYRDLMREMVGRERWRFIVPRPQQNGRHFAADTPRCIFLNENNHTNESNFTEFIPKGPIDSWVSIGWGYDLVASRQQASTWSHDDYVLWRLMASQGHIELS